MSSACRLLNMIDWGGCESCGQVWVCKVSVIMPISGVEHMPRRVSQIQGMTFIAATVARSRLQYCGDRALSISNASGIESAANVTYTLSRSFCFRLKEIKMTLYEAHHTIYHCIFVSCTFNSGSWISISSL